MTATLPDTTQAAFLAAIRANLADDAPRLIYADWLEENGQVERAEFIRVQCSLAVMDHVCDDMWSCQQCKDLAAKGLKWMDIEPLRRRESELLLNWPKWFSIKTNCVRVCENPIEGSDPSLINGGLRFKFSRGFVSRVSATFGVLCGERCERCGGDGRVDFYAGQRYSDVGGNPFMVQCEPCQGTGRTPGVLRDIVRSEVAAVEYVDVSDLIIDRDHDGSYSCYRFVNRFGPIIDPKKLVLHRSEAAARAALSRAMLEAAWK